MKRFKLIVLCLLVLSLTFMVSAKNDNKPNKANLVSSNIEQTIVTFDVTDYKLNDLEKANGLKENAQELDAPFMYKTLKKGAPEVLKMATSIIVPDDAEMKLVVQKSQYTDIPNVEIAPSKGNLLRNVDPETVPYVYGPEYQTDAFFPGDLATLGDPYIARDYRGHAIVVYPFQYNPVTKVLRVYHEIKVKIKTTGKRGKNIKTPDKNKNKKKGRAFEEVYTRHFLNYNAAAQDENLAEVMYTPVNDDFGNYLIISYSSFMDEMADFKTWKESIGYTVDLVDYSTIGSSSALKTYVSNYYNTNGLTFLLLVGDHAQVPVSSTSAGDSDTNYGYIVGNDHYLDIFVGRFSAETAAHVTTQVDRTLYYERDLSSSASFFSNAIGMGSSEGPGHNNEYDYQHINNILTDCSNYGYTTYTNHQSGGSTSALSSLINAGAGVMFYCGHGSDTAWTCGWTFSVTNVNALTNDDELPFIFHVACVVGNFKNQTCFCESWMRATNNGNPTGAIANCGSTINQSWEPPMTAQDEMADIMVAASKRTFGGVYANGMFEMIDVHGSGGESMADTWTCFGDPSVQLRTPGTPDGPASGPIGPTANFTADNTTVVMGSTVNFTDTSSGDPTSWSWTFSGGTPASSTSQNPSVTYNTDGVYDVSLTATNANGNDTETKTGYITVTDGSVTYCTASGDNQNYEWVAGVEVGTMNNTSGAAPYSDYTSITCNLTEGQSVNVTLTPGFASTVYSEYWKIWIDYNKDGDFDDSGEEVFSGSGSSTVTGSFTPATGYEGTTRMRVVMDYSSSISACGTFTYGEVEDYTVNISAATGQPPVANFTASPTTITEGGSVNFTDTSTNTPTSWSWTFTGGTPSSSTAQNPTVTYATAGTYSVTLQATNAHGSDTETKTSYITVNPSTVTYCTASGNNQNYEWAAGVQVGNLNNSSGASSYSDFTNQTANLTPGSSVSVTLTPGFASGSYTEYWKIWIDYNKDGDFDDSGEEVFSSSGSSTVTGSFTVSSSATGSTRMRVIMRYGSAPSSCGTFTYGEVEDYTVSF